MNEIVYISNKPASDGASCGASFSILIGDAVFRICHSYDLPWECTVVSPPHATQLPQARQLADYLVFVLGFQRVLFYDELNEAFREADFPALTQFDEAEPHAPDSDFLTHEELVSTN